MTTTEQRVPRLWRRELSSYPTVAPRIGYLSLAVFATVILYYQLYVGSSVSTLILDRFHMSFTFYVVALAIGSLIGAFGSLLAGVTDRFGRANLVVCGLFLAGALTALAIPASPNKWVLTLFTFAVGAVAGFCLTATPALVRDFSPRLAERPRWGSGRPARSLEASWSPLSLLTRSVPIHLLRRGLTSSASLGSSDLVLP